MTTALIVFNIRRNGCCVHMYIMYICNLSYIKYLILFINCLHIPTQLVMQLAVHVGMYGIDLGCQGMYRMDLLCDSEQ